MTSSARRDEAVVARLSRRDVSRRLTVAPLYHIASSKPPGKVLVDWNT
jgi:hypothetical protein